jgi:flagellar basal-body rod protein FlgC
MNADRPMNVFDIAGRAMSAQLVRLNTTASNLANAGSVSGTRAGAFQALRPVFRTVEGGPGIATVQVESVVRAGVDTAAELIDMVETARQYQNNVQVLQTAKTLTLDTLRLGQ